MGVKVVSTYETGDDTEISITPTIQSGTKIADYEIDGVAGALYVDMSGKNHISYGTSTPSAPGINGDLYIALNGSNQKTGMYLYITDAWVQIE
jgi:hypothetical protein